MKSSFSAVLFWSFGSALGLAACGGSAPPADDPAAVPPPAVGATPPAPASSAAPGASASSTAATLAEPAAPEKTCASAPGIEICSRECKARNATACETLGELHVKQEDGELPGFSMAYALSAFGEACALGAKSACDKADAHWKALRAACQKNAKDCSALGRAAAGQDGRDKEADQSFSRACDAGDSTACEARGVLHQDWEPATVHAPIAAQSLDRACAKGLSSACCSLIKLYVDTSQEKKADLARKRFEVVNDKSTGPRLACDVFDMRRKPTVKVVAKADAPSAKALTKAEIASLERVFASNVPYCYTEAPKAPPISTSISSRTERRSSFRTPAPTRSVA